jgi:hypothetical protein
MGGFDEASFEVSDCWSGVSSMYCIHYRSGLRIRRLPNAVGLVSQILTPLLIAAGASATFFRKQVGGLLAGLLRRLRLRADV